METSIKIIFVAPIFAVTICHILCQGSFDELFVFSEEQFVYAEDELLQNLKPDFTDFYLRAR